MRLVSIKRNFLEKVAFYTCEENTQSLKGGLSCPFFQKSMLVLIYPLGWIGQLPNYPSPVLNSHACSSFLSSLLSILPTPCCYKHSTTQLSPTYHHNQQNQQNPFQHLIIQTQNQQNQTKNNSKSTQNNLKSTQTPLENPSQTQLKINPKQNQLKIKTKIYRKSTQN